MKGNLCRIFLVLGLIFSLNISVVTYADESSTKPQNSNIKFKVEEADGKYLINYEDVGIDPEYVDALLVINGKMMTGNYAVLKDGFSLIPLRVVSDALGIGIEWNGQDRSIRLEKDNKTILLTVDVTTATVDGTEIELDVPAQIINASTYVPARFVAENMNCTIQFNDNVIKLTKEYANTGSRIQVPIVSIEQNANLSITPMTQEQAVDMVKTTITTMFTQHYRSTKTNPDINLFLEQVAYKNASKSMGRFYRVEIHFYDQWSKRFESYAYVDSYTRQLYLGDYQYGLTEELLPYLSKKYENHLAIENKATKIIPFSEMNVVEDSPLVYVNFPEQIPVNALLETYYNHLEKIKDSGRVFLSHKNMAKQTIDYVIRFKNELNSEVTLTIVEDKAIHTTEQYQDQAVKAHMERFYNRKLSNENQKIVLQPGEVYDTAVKNIKDEQFFTGIVDFHASDNVSITVFAIPSSMAKGKENYNEFSTPTEMYDYNYTPKTYQAAPISSGDPAGENQYYSVYSGLGASYKVEAKGTINASEMTKLQSWEIPWNIAFETGGSPNNINQRRGLTEIVDIELLEPRGEQNEITKATWYGNIENKGVEKDGSERLNKNMTGNYGNLGNWGVEYIVTVQLNNDTDTDKLFGCELVPLHQTTWAFIVNNHAAVVNINNKKYMDTFSRKDMKEYDQIQIGSGIKSGRVDSVVVKAHEKKELTYTYALGTDCESTVFHVWTCIDAE